MANPPWSPVGIVKREIYHRDKSREFIIVSVFKFFITILVAVKSHKAVLYRGLLSRFPCSTPPPRSPVPPPPPPPPFLRSPHPDGDGPLEMRFQPLRQFKFLITCSLIATPEELVNLYYTMWTASSRPLSVSLALFYLSIYLSLSVSFSRNSLGIGWPYGLKGVLYFAFIVVLEASRHFSRVYCVGCASLRRIDGSSDALFGLVYNLLSHLTNSPGDNVCPSLLSSVNRFYELIAAVYQLDVIPLL